ncbi:hypothetical protein BV20DRAFT_1123769 [Pilatotrama ljubarskyi]|nr:hypothetical protein BV20DRAFT_1123769 [Pilatotrama ljubarskyi]
MPCMACSSPRRAHIMPSPQPYKGLVRKLVLGIDVGTTYSGVAYAILDPGEVPKIEDVRRYPGQEHFGSTKIPSILYYYPDGTVHSVGAEAAQPCIDFEAEQEGLIFVDWFKLHLRPEHLDSRDDAVRATLRPLPDGKTVLDIFSDFLRYLYRCARTYISETHPSGGKLWTKAATWDNIEFILSHPNGWGGLQQAKMREAAVAGGLIPDTPAGYSRVQFVTEGEASMNFCIRNGFAQEKIQAGQNIMIIDAGGGTVDICSYSFPSLCPLTVEEAAPADCLLHGSIQVNVRAQDCLRARLRKSTYGNDDDITSMVDYFDKSTKPVFRNADEPSYVKFGSISCNDPSVMIRRGQLVLSGKEMASFFRPSLDAIIQAAHRQCRASAQPFAVVLLVGGFAASPWLYTVLRKDMQKLGLPLFRPDAQTDKAVAEGAVSFYLEHFVSARVMSTTYGTRSCVHYDVTDPEHYARRADKAARPSGRIVLQGGFSTILAKGKRMREGEEISHQYGQEAYESRTLDTLAADILCYRGQELQPRWVDRAPEMFVQLCTIHADTSGVRRTPKRGTNGGYYQQKFEIVLICGLTELQVQIKWVENGVEKRGPAQIVYSEDLEVSL